MSLTASPRPETAAPARRLHESALSKSSLRHASDDRLVALTRGGSERAFAEIMRRYQRPLQFYCLHMVGAPRAEDAVQQAFMQAFVALRDGERREIALRPWLYRIARNCAIDILRKQPFEHDELDPEFDGTAQPPGLVEQKEELARIVAAIQALPERQRRALTLRELEGRSYGEISAELGHTDSGVRQLIFRARTALRNLGAFILPLGSVRWRLLGSPSAGADQIAAAATTSSGGSHVVQAAASVFVATLALVGAGSSGGARHGARSAASEGVYAATRSTSPVEATVRATGAQHRRTRVGHRADAARGEDGGVEPSVFAPVPDEADEPAAPALSAEAGQASERAAPEAREPEEPMQLEAQEATPDSSGGAAGDSGTTDPSAPAPSGGAAAAPAEDWPGAGQGQEQSPDGGAATKPVAPTPPAPPKVSPPKAPIPPRLIVPKRPAMKRPVPPRPPAQK